ncbi:alpha/beta hydrolase [Parasalinivibrio latis]|uniref:esterase/lipase family protein n=1 Tax=Parasalinivibrio latis TaxID=2952610 RepID=UPI0030E44EF1
MAKVIVLIHGRSQKPDIETLTAGWKSAINEGLLHSTTLPSLKGVKVEMVYYADLHYTNGPVADSDNEEPYLKAEPGSIRRYKLGLIDRLRRTATNWFDTPIDWLEEHSKVFSTLARKIAKKMLKDLGKYYSQPTFKTSVDNRLRDVLVENKDNEIILVSHSMGTIVAYEVLRKLGRDNQVKDFQLEHWITLGSPLGISAVQGNIINTHNRLRTPSCVRASWVNFSDPGDFVCLDTHLADDYEANSTKIGVKDILVCNDYPNNEHKSYGYLRTPEFSEHLASLL